MRKRIAILILAIILSHTLVSCRSDYYDLQFENLDFDFDGGFYQNNDNVMDRGPVKGGNLRLFSTYPDTFNPLLTKNTYVKDFLNFVYEGLVTIDEKQQPKPLLSDSWTVSGDKLSWSFHIRDGITWSDGRDFTAEDVEFTINLILNATFDSVYKLQLINVASVSALDKNTVKLVLKKPDSFMAEKLMFPVIPAHINITSYEKEGFKPVGTGPFIFDSYVKEKSVVLKKNENWWYLKADGDNVRDALMMDQITIRLYKNSEDCINAFQVFDIDVASIGMDDINKYTSRTDMLMKVFPSREFEFLAFNLKNPIFGDISVRKAVLAAINRQIILKEILNGFATISDIPVHPDSWLLGEGDKDEASRSAAGTPDEILQQGGWKKRDNGYFKSFNGVNKKLEIDLLVNNNNSRRILIAERICQQLLEAGISAKVTRLPWSSVNSSIDTGKFDMVYTGCRVTQAPDISFLYTGSYLASSLPLHSDTGRNISGYENAEINDLVNRLYSETDTAVRKNLIKSFRNIVHSDLPYIGMFFLDNAVIYRKNVRGTLEPNIWNKYYDIAGWYLPEIE